MRSTGDDWDLEVDELDICEHILHEHDEQPRSFAMLDEIDPNDLATLGTIWQQLAAFLERHAKAEEDLFYPDLLALGKRLRDDSEREQTLDAIGDHNDIRDGVKEAAGHDVGSDGWWKGVRAARKANDDHMAEEEREGLTDFRRHVDLGTRHQIAMRFVDFEADHFGGVPIVNEDPERYVEQNTP